MSPGGPPPPIGSSISPSVAQSITAADVDLSDNELITGTSSTLVSLSNVSNTEAKGLSITSSGASAAIRSSHHSMSSTSTVISRDNPPVKALAIIYRRYFSKISETIKLDSVTFATQLMSASIIDPSVVQKVTFTQGWTPPQQANAVLFDVETGLKNSKDPAQFFIDFCSVLQEYVHAKEIAIDMMRDASK